MKLPKSIFLILFIIISSCTTSDDAEVIVAPKAGILSGGSYEFMSDLLPDLVSELTLDSSGVTGDENDFLIVRKEDHMILKNIKSIEELKKENFDTYDDFEGDYEIYQIYHIAYKTDLKGLTVGKKITDLMGNYSLSNAIDVKLLRLKAAKFEHELGHGLIFNQDGIPDYITRANGLIFDNSLEVGLKSKIMLVGGIGGEYLIQETFDSIEEFETFDFDTTAEGSLFVVYALTYGEDEAVEIGRSTNTKEYQERYNSKNNKIGESPNEISIITHKR